VAVAIARQVVREAGVAWDEHRGEDIAQTLFLAGWEVWRDTGDVGLAKNRMRTRESNARRDLGRDLRKPKPESTINAEPGTARLSERRVDRRTAPAEEAAISDWLDRLPERQQQIVRFSMAGLLHEEIGAELGISTRTVERELSQIRRDHQDER
jgi:RNA polymerase sigma factor (sigma-70 family)